MNPGKDTAALAGRVLLALMFVVAGFGKIGSFEETAAYIASTGLPMPQVGVVIGIVVEVAGGLLLMAGWKARWAALALAAFSVAATYFFHNFWSMTGPAAQTNQLLFMKNISVIGGLLMVWAFGPGRYSVDRE